MLEQLPPHDILAEEAVIGAALVDESVLVQSAPLLKPGDFFREKNGWVWEACVGLWQAGTVVNQVTVAHELARRERLEPIGGMAYLSKLVADLVTVVGADHYARIVKRCATYRHLIIAAGSIARSAYDGGDNVDGVLSAADELLTTIREERTTSGYTHLASLLDGCVEQALAHDGGQAQGVVRTGFSQLDMLLGGLKPSDLVLVAARPSMGKSALASAIARNAATGQGAKVGFFTLEMAGNQVAQRLLCAEADLNSARLRTGHLTESEEKRMTAAVGRLSELSIYIDDAATLTVEELRGRAKRMKQERGLDIVIVDYLQLISGGSRRSESNRAQEVSYISRSLKGLARELAVPVLALSQLSRAVEGRNPPIPMLSDLRDSGAIEQDADVVMFIYREGYYTDLGNVQDETAQLIVAKHRNGPVGSIDVRFKASTVAFTDLHIRREGG